MWADHIDDFPADKWRADVLAGLEVSGKEITTDLDKIVVGYIIKTLDAPCQRASTSGW
jgi:hypothetical protein